MRRVAWLAWPLAVVAIWAALVVSGTDPRAALAGPLEATRGSPWFALALLAAYLVRAVVLLPATLLTVLAGVVLGPVWGTLLAAVGATASALVAYALARGARRHGREPGAGGNGHGALHRRLGRLGQRLREDAFAATLIARLAFLPGDVVNVVAGTSRVPWRPFAAATALGGAPGLVAAVLAGASLEHSSEAGSVSVDPWVLAASVALAVTTAVTASWARRRAGLQRSSLRSPDAPDRTQAREGHRPRR